MCAEFDYLLNISSYPVFRPLLCIEFVYLFSSVDPSISWFTKLIWRYVDSCLLNYLTSQYLFFVDFCLYLSNILCFYALFISVTFVFLFCSLKHLCIRGQSSKCLYSTCHLKFFVKLLISSFGWVCCNHHYPHYMDLTFVCFSRIWETGIFPMVVIHLYF